MSNLRRPVSLLTSLSFGLGAALLLLLAASGWAPAALAAKAPAGPNPPLPANCHARNDSNTLLVYDSADSLAVRLAVAAALPNDTVRLAGTCAGVAAGGGTTQTVLINKVLTLAGGYTPTDWVNSFPISQPTTLDALGQGRVITASGDITIANLTVQNGNSAGGDGGGIWDGHDLTMLDVVNILSNTTLVSTSVAGSAAPAGSSGGNGGGEWVQDALRTDAPGLHFIETKDFEANTAINGGCAFALAIEAQNLEAANNLAIQYAGCLYSAGTLDVQNAILEMNKAAYGGGWAAGGQVNFHYTTFFDNTATNYGGSGVTLGGSGANFYNVMGSFNTAGLAGGEDYHYGEYAQYYSSLFSFNAAPDGATIFASSSPLLMQNTLIIGGLGNRGNALYVTKFLPYDFVVSLLFNIFINSHTTTGDVSSRYNDVSASFDPFHLVDAAGARPSAGAVISPGSAVFVDGATLFVTDTIIGGYATDIAASSAPSTSVHEDYNLFEHTPVFSGTVITGGHSLVGNPLFADNLGHLSAGSPAIDHGIDVGVNVDFDGNPRPSGAGFDIGAYEYVAALLKLFLPLVRR